MRTLFLLRGAPGAGKSTWIANNNLGAYVDLMLCGHTHQLESTKEGNLLYAQYGSYGENVGHITLTYDTLEKEVSSTKELSISSKSNINKEREVLSDIPVIKNSDLSSQVVGHKHVDVSSVETKVSSPNDKKEEFQKDLFPDLPVIEENFFDEDELKDLNNYMESDDKKNGWF